jgi:hypothetical protein
LVITDSEEAKNNEEGDPIKCIALLMWGVILKRQTIGIVFTRVCILLITTPTSTREEGLGNEVLSHCENMYRSNEVYGPIHIWNNSHFIEQAEAEDWDGDGNESTPFIIDAYNITSDNIIIMISDVSLHFVIRLSS